MSFQNLKMIREKLRVWELWRICALQWRHNGRDGVSNHQHYNCLLNRLFRRRSKNHQSSASLAFARGIHRSPVNSPHKWPVTRKMFPFDDVIMRPPTPGTMISGALKGCRAKSDIKKTWDILKDIMNKKNSKANFKPISWTMRNTWAVPKYRWQIQSVLHRNRT